jgi:hypothetical protein
MFELESLAKMGLTGWPLVTAIAFAILGFVSLFQGWPWTGVITINQCKCKKRKGDDE